MQANIDKKIPSSLFELISVLSPTEQRHLVIELGGAGKPDKKTTVSLAIYKSLQGLKAYNKDKYLKKLNKLIPDPDQYDRVLSRLSFEEANLQNKIRRFLRNSSSAHYQHIQVKEMLMDVRLLIERGLMHQAQSLIGQIREKAVYSGDTLALLETNREERTLVHAILPRNSEKFTTRMDELFAEEKMLRKQLKQEFANQTVFDNLSTYQQVIASKQLDLLPVQLQEKLEQALQDASADQETLSLFAKMRALQIQSILNTFSAGRQYINNTSSMMDWWHEHPIFMKEQLFRYWISFSLFLNSFQQMRNEENIDLIINILRKKIADLPHRDYIEFRHINISLFSLFMNAKKMDHAISLANEISIGLKNHQLAPSTELSLIYNLAICYFINGDFDKADSFFSHMKTLDTANSIAATLLSSHLLSLICMLEANKKQDEKKLRHNLNRRLEKTKEIFKAPLYAKEATIYLKSLEYIHQFAKSHEKPSPESLHKWQNELSEFQKNTPPGLIRGIEELQIWIESQLSGLSIRQAYLKKH